jgi:structural maintenance of chromosome 4
MFVCSVWQAAALTSNNNAKAVTLRQQYCDQNDMSATSPRQSRRTAASRRRVVDSDDDMDMDVDMSDDVAHTQTAHADEQDEDEEEYTPAPVRSTRHSKSVPPTPQTASRTRRDPVVDHEVLEDATSPTKPKRRTAKTARTARKSHISTSLASEADASIIATPQQSTSPSMQQHKQATPLADITESSVNDQTPRASSRHLPSSQVHKVDTNTTLLEKPMDIVVRTRAAATMPVSQTPDGPRSRTVITHLVLKNFKSYAGRQEVGPFHASFSSVVGPNGSGKSNVIDSLLFVFGFRASKMRQGKISALIHNSAAYPDLDHCEVEVHFQQVMDLPAGGHTVIADSQLVISRRAFKNNASKYYINGRESNFTAVTTLLRDRGVDLDHKRFLILQGEVESIAQMKPKAANEHDDGLLEYLEDIIGTSKYKTPRRKL